MKKNIPLVATLTVSTSLFGCSGGSTTAVDVELEAPANNQFQRQGTEARVKKLVSEILRADANQITLASHFADDLGADSLDSVEIVMATEEEFKLVIPDKDAMELHTIRELVNYINEKLITGP